MCSQNREWLKQVSWSSILRRSRTLETKEKRRVYNSRALGLDNTPHLIGQNNNNNKNNKNNNNNKKYSCLKFDLSIYSTSNGRAITCRTYPNTRIRKEQMRLMPSTISTTTCTVHLSGWSTWWRWRSRHTWWPGWLQRETGTRRGSRSGAARQTPGWRAARWTRRRMARCQWSRERSLDSTSSGQEESDEESETNRNNGVWRKAKDNLWTLANGSIIINTRKRLYNHKH